MKTLFSLLAVLLLTLSLYAQNQTDEQALHQVVNTMSEAWTAGDGQAFASVFAEQHDFIVWNGYYLKDSNLQLNADGHQRIFDTIYKDTKMHSTIDKIEFVRDDLALIHVFAAVTKQGEDRPEHPQVLWSGVVEKIDGQWKIISFHNLDLEVFQDEGIRKSAPMPMEVMYASWYAAG